MVAEINKFIEISNNIDVILKSSPYKTNYIIKSLGMKEGTFFKKLREKKFSPIELLDISKIICPDEYKEQEELKAIREAEQDITMGNLHSYEEYRVNARKRIEVYKLQ